MMVFSVLLNAQAPERNIRRSYLLEAGEDLFGTWVVEIHYGRIGGKGRKRVLVMEGEEHAKREVRKRLNKRESAVNRIGAEYRVVCAYGADWCDAYADQAC